VIEFLENEDEEMDDDALLELIDGG